MTAGANLQRRDARPVAVFIEKVASVARDSNIAPVEHVIEIDGLCMFRIHQAGENITAEKMENDKANQKQRQNKGGILPL